MSEGIATTETVAGWPHAPLREALQGFRQRFLEHNRHVHITEPWVKLPKRYAAEENH